MGTQKKPIMIPTKTQVLSVCSALLLGFSSAALADDYGYYSNNELQAPDVSFYAALQGASSNLHYLGGDREGGFNLLVGGYFNDVKIAGLRYGVEVGYQNFGESKNSNSRKLEHSDFNVPPAYPPVYNASRLEMVEKLRLSSLSFGGRLEGDLFFFRFGGALYNYHASSQKLAHFVYTGCGTGGCPDTQQLPTYSESASSLAPYLGIGLHIPLIEHLRLTAGYDVYNVESHRMDNITIGLMYTD